MPVLLVNVVVIFFFFNDTATTEIYTLSLHDALPISKVSIALEAKERNLLKLLHDYPQTVQQAAENLSPALIANFAYDLAKEYNQFYHEHQILKEPDEPVRNFRLGLSAFVGQTIQSAMGMLGIEVPERM